MTNAQAIAHELGSHLRQYASACMLEINYPDVVDWLLEGRIPRDIRRTLLHVSAVRHEVEHPRRLRLVVNNQIVSQHATLQRTED